MYVNVCAGDEYGLVLNQSGIDTGWTVGFRVLAEANDFFLHSVQTGSGAHPASFGMGSGGSFSGGKAAGA
jgi:hypothetical protein